MKTKYLNVSQYFNITTPNNSTYQDKSSMLSKFNSTKNLEILPSNITSIINNIDDKKSNIDPKIWGPIQWKIFHKSSLLYPVNPSGIYKERMKNYILGIPYVIPCDDCRKHALNYITTYENELDEICSSRSSLFKFFVDFHNSVNERLNKKTMSYQEAIDLYKI